MNNKIVKWILMISTFIILVFGTYGILNELNDKQEKAVFDSFARGWVEGYEGRGQYEVFYTIVYDSLDPVVGYLAYSLKDGEDIVYLSEFNFINDKWWSYMGKSSYEGKEEDFRNPESNDLSELSISSLLE